MQRIDLSTLRGLPDNGHGLDRWRTGCRHWASRDLTMLARNGVGERPVQDQKPRCRKRGSIWEWQVRPSLLMYYGATRNIKGIPGARPDQGRLVAGARFALSRSRFACE
ncbi:MAG: hypothetical protein ACREVZ_02280 [Burkholderiales bacterium]